MSVTLSVVTEKVFISPFRSGSDGSHIQFYDDGCIAVLFSVVEHTNIPVHDVS